MSSPSPPAIVFVDTELSLVALLTTLDGLSTQPYLFIDLEGRELSRHGSISILSLYLSDPNTVYLIDIHSLKKSAFSTTNSLGTSLKSVLECPVILKVIFDVRNNSDALFAHYQVSLRGIKDVQLMELASRRGGKDFVAGLAKCIETDTAMSSAAKAEWRCTKDVGARLFAPELGGAYEVFDERPLRPEIIRYCAQDVACLPTLYRVYEEKLRGGFWPAQVEGATNDRIIESQSASYEPHGRQKARGPWSKEDIGKARAMWNDDDLDDDNWYPDTAQDCEGWEDDMIKNGEPF